MTDKQLILGKKYSHDTSFGHFKTNAPYWPKIMIGLYDKYPNFNSLAVGTVLRKEKEGVWYKELHIRRRQLPSNFSNKNLLETKEDIMKELLHGVYLSIMVGTVNPDMEHYITGPAWPKDDIQVDESKRILNKMGIKTKEDYK